MWEDDNTRAIVKKRAHTSAYTSAHTTVQDVHLWQHLVQDFISRSDKDVILDKTGFALPKHKFPVRDVLNRIKGYLEGGRITMPYDKRNAAIQGTYAGEEVVFWFVIDDHGEVSTFKIEVWGCQEAVDGIALQIKTDFVSENLPLIKWWFEGRHGPETKDFYFMSDAADILPEFYPDLGNPKEYLNDYMTSDESVLLIAGPPGTGKTTLLRHLITSYKLCAHVIYDERLMQKDGPFQEFIFGNTEYGPPHDDDIAQDNIMIIEDADTILTSREHDNNKLMSRFLNVSDGLIKLPNKKLVFTTNITDFGTIDSALLRPGRCFGVMHTRALNLSEAQAAARAAGVPIPLEKREYTLAEIFNQGKTATVRSIGFGIRH